MKASRSHNAFALKCSVQLVMECGMGKDALTILKSQPEYKKTKKKVLPPFMGANASIQVLSNLRNSCKIGCEWP